MYFGILKKMDKKTKQIEELNKQVEDLKQQVEETTASWKRALADYQNLERRMSEQKESWISYASESLINKLLPVLEHLEKAGEHLKDEGLNIALKQLNDLLKNEGLTEVPAMGEEFDPVQHECIETTDGTENNKIVEVFNKGYKLNNKLLRPSRVKVSKVSKIDEEENHTEKTEKTDKLNPLF